ncbi:MAG: BlaI/MecI/CopY family transcriptional regulator [bacterium]|nr:BlaI/MecI/CopY family transcriptional regulator [bacterium]
MDTQYRFGHILGELEIDVMNIIWERGNAVSVREVVEALSGKRKIAYTTVMTIMGRLVTKGILKQEPQGRAFVYKAVYTKDSFLAKATKQIVKNLASNFGDMAIAHFVKEVEKIPLEKRERLLEILDEKEE